MAGSEPSPGYEKCIFFDTFYDCGEHKKSRKSGIFSVTALSGDVINHLQNLGLNTTDSTQQQYSFLTEKRLKNRTGIYLSADDVICAFHRFKFGIYWKRKDQCQHPNHLKRGFQHSKKSRFGLRPASLEMARRIEEEFAVSFPVGESICDVHRKDIKAGGHRHDVDGDSDSEAVVFPEDTGSVNDFVGKVIDKESASPMKFQITSPVRQLAPSTVRYLGRKYKQYALEFKKCLCEKIAPGQGVHLEKIL